MLLAYCCIFGTNTDNNYNATNLAVDQKLLRFI